MRASPRSAASPHVREAAGRLYQQHLDRWLLETSPGAPFLRDPTSRGGAVSSFLEDLARLYRVQRWTPASFERAFLLGALAAWRPGTIVRQAADGYRVLAPACPLGAQVEVEPSACRSCRSFQEAVARRALGERAKYVSFHALIADGEGVCDARFHVPEAC